LHPEVYELIVSADHMVDTGELLELPRDPTRPWLRMYKRP